MIVVVPLIAAWLAAQEAAPVEGAVVEGAAEAPPTQTNAPAVTEVELPQPVSSAAPSSAKLVRVVVQEVEVPPGEERLRAIFTSSLVTEVRKLAGVSVAGLDEVRALLDVAADRQMAGCDEAGCLSEVADALGASVVVNARLSTLGEENIIAFRRLDATTGKVSGVDRRFAKSDGEEFLAAIGPAVAELFPDFALRAGASRGVDKEAALRLNPPPLQPWMFVTIAGASGVALATGGAAGALSALFEGRAEEKIARSVTTAIDGVDVKRDVEAADASALVANVALVTGGALLAGAAVAFFFTDFEGYADAP
jgi:hypothetical protein